ncbi:uncharacterized protein LOC121419791 [Lytechinus variegatus]|uniref:uncharacterized protein LOC121419791 n=1 Tax=Lytechinus variegatus TaxID=7654 RepID=UPI001BB26483|nr:uncharacterized protein LOC121419791 [Lytechinus variegatus]
MARSGFCQILVLMYLSHFIKLDVAQIILGDEASQSIFFAPLPGPENEISVFNVSFRRIELGSQGSTIRLIDYEPADRKVYWRNDNDDVVRARVDLAGTPPTVEPYLTGPINSFSIDTVRRHIYFTYSDPAEDGKIYYRSDLFSSAPTRPFIEFPANYSRLSVQVDSINRFLYYTSPGSKMLGVLDISARTTKVSKPFSAQALVFETCLTRGSTPPSSRLYYYKDSQVLGYTDTLNSETLTLGTLPDRSISRLDMAKYGSKLFFIRVTSGSSRLTEYDTMSSSFEIYDSIQISYSVANISMNRTINPSSIRIINDNYTEPVTIVDCPMDISVPISSTSVNGTRQVSWTEPSLNAWSNCATLEFLGQGTNGGNFSEGIYSMSYQALDTRGNTDVCNFTVTVMNNDASGNGIKTSCNVLQVATALFITMITVFI